MKHIYVIGNGFDIDLGWHTSYKEFYETKLTGWKVHFGPNDDCLPKYLLDHAGDNWYDLERTLYDYCLSKSKGNSKGMTEGQERKIWRLMYELQELSPSSAALGERLCGIIKKEFKIDATSKSPLAWFSFNDASKMIEILKRYVSSAEKKAKGG